MPRGGLGRALKSALRGPYRVPIIYGAIEIFGYQVCNHEVLCTVRSGAWLMMHNSVYEQALRVSVQSL